jgi:hypothetical protein
MLKIKTIESKLTPTSIEFKCIIFGESILKTRTINLFNNKCEFSWTEDTTLDNSDKIVSISYPISEKAYTIMKRVYSEGDLIEAAEIFSLQQHFISLKINYNFKKIKKDNYSPVIIDLKKLNINISDYKIKEFFKSKYSELFPKHSIYYLSLDEIYIYYEADMKMIASLNHYSFNFFNLSAKYNFETKLYYMEDENYYNKYTVIGFVEKNITKENLKESDITQISIKDFMEQQINKLNNV